jgi:hypothetical protein
MVGEIEGARIVIAAGAPRQPSGGGGAPGDGEDRQSEQGNGAHAEPGAGVGDRSAREM